MGSNAEYVYDAGQDRDELHRAGAMVILEVDDTGSPVVKISTAQDVFVRIDYNNDTVHEVAPTEKEREALVAVRDAKEAAKSDTDKLREAIGARMGVADALDPVAVTQIAVEEAAKLAAEAPAVGVRAER